MNERQRQILALGMTAAAAAFVLGTTWLRPPAVGPEVEHAPGRFSTEMTDAVMPKWAVRVSVGLAAVTAVAVYTSRTRR